MKLAVWRRWTLTLMFVVLACSLTFAQGGRGGQRGGRGGGGGFGGFGGGGGFGGFGGGGGGDVALALRDEVKKELDLSDDQVGEIEDLRQDSPNMFQMMRDAGISRDMSQDEREEAFSDLRKKIAKANEKVNEDVLDVMKSKQKKRFEEIKFQYALIKQMNPVGALTGADVDLDDDEKEELNDARAKVEAEVQKRMAKVRLELYMEAMAKAGVSESKVEKLMGELFEFAEGRGRGGPPGFGGGGQRGGRGGGDAGGRGGRRGGDAGGGGNRRRAGGAEEDGDANPRRRRPN